MNNFNFSKDEISLIWNNRVCYIAIQVAEIMKHEFPSKATSRALKFKDFKEGVDYEVLIKDELKNFKKMVLEFSNYEIKYAPKIIILYESGLSKFLEYLNTVLYKNNLESEHRESKEISVGNSVKMFKDKEVHTLMWNGKPCWIAIEVADILGYKRVSMAINQCILSEEFEKGIDYEILKYEEIKELIQAICFKHTASEKKITHLTILYKEGLLGFINYSHMPIGKDFRKWLRKEVFRGLLETENTIKIKEKDSYNCGLLSMDNLRGKENFDMTLKILKFVDDIGNEKNKFKIDCLTYIFSEK